MRELTLSITQWYSLGVDCLLWTSVSRRIDMRLCLPVLGSKRVRSHSLALLSLKCNPFLSLSFSLSIPSLYVYLALQIAPSLAYLRQWPAGDQFSLTLCRLSLYPFNFASPLPFKLTLTSTLTFALSPSLSLSAVETNLIKPSDIKRSFEPAGRRASRLVS